MVHVVLLAVGLIIAVILVMVDIRRGRQSELRTVALLHSLEHGADTGEPGPSAEVKQAMIVEGAPALRANLVRVLMDEGYRVTDVRVGGEALVRLNELASLSPAVLAMVDWNMPGLSGLEFVRSVRSNAAHRAVRIVIMTPDADLEQVTTALEVGAYEYLVKPFTTEAVLNKLGSRG
jgi:two-component system chemotaxis response regulator CheY